MLSKMAVRQAKANDKDYKLSDSEGLYMFVAKSGHRSWRLKYRFAGKRRRLILGAYPEVSLKEARDRKIEARKQLAEGRDPGLEAKKAAIARAMSAANTFEVVARSWLALQEDRWTPVHARDVISSLEKEVFFTTASAGALADDFVLDDLSFIFVPSSLRRSPNPP